MYIPVDSPLFHIRPADRPGDLDVIVDITYRAFTLGWDKEHFEGFLRLPGMSCFVAALGSIVVGYMLVEKRADHIYIGLIASDYRRCGIGTRLLKWLEEHLPEFKRTSIQLHCRANEEAPNSFYLANGYVEIDRLPGEYRDGIDAVVYQKTPDTAMTTGSSCPAR